LPGNDKIFSWRHIKGEKKRGGKMLRFFFFVREDTVCKGDFTKLG